MYATGIEGVNSRTTSLRVAFLAAISNDRSVGRAMSIAL